MAKHVNIYALCTNGLHATSGLASQIGYCAVVHIESNPGETYTGPVSPIDAMLPCKNVESKGHHTK